MKRFITLILVFSLLLCVPTLAAELSLEVKSTLNADGTMTYTVSANENPGVAGIELYLYFSEGMSPNADSLKYGSLLSGSGMALSNLDGGTGTDEYVQIFWFSATDTTGDGELFSVTFTPAQDAAALVRLEGEMYNERLDTLAFTASGDVVDEFPTPPEPTAPEPTAPIEQTPVQPIQPAQPIPAEPAPTEPETVQPVRTQPPVQEPETPPAELDKITSDSIPETENTPPAVSFTDVSPSDWFFEEVSAAASLGLIKGKQAPDGSYYYDPGEELTFAQAITLAVRLHRTLEAGETPEESSEGAEWYLAYSGYALDHGLITSAPADYNAPITRGETALIFSRVLGNDYTVLNPQSDYFADVSRENEYADAIYALFAAGIIQGKDETNRLFAPGDTLKRSEAAAIIVRFLDENTRKSIY